MSLGNREGTAVIGLSASDLVAAALRRLIAERGEAAAQERLAPLARATLGRLAGGLAVKSTTLIYAAGRLGVSLAGCLGSPLPDDAIDETEAPPSADAAAPMEPR